MQLTWKFDGIQEFIEKYGAINNPDIHAKWDTQVAQATLRMLSIFMMR
jgi:hypothetical protein